MNVPRGRSFDSTTRNSNSGFSFFRLSPPQLTLQIPQIFNSSDLALEILRFSAQAVTNSSRNLDILTWSPFNLRKSAPEVAVDRLDEVSRSNRLGGDTKLSKYLISCFATQVSRHPALLDSGLSLSSTTWFSAAEKYTNEACDFSMLRSIQSDFQSVKRKF